MASGPVCSSKTALPTLVERALNPANDCIDAFPLAL
jgi:hypothetical protein